MSKKIKKEQLLIGVLAVILLIVIFLPLPEKDAADTKEEPVLSQENVREQKTTEERLKEILQKISGVGAVEVLLTYEDDGRLVIEKDESASEEEVREADSGGGTRTTVTARTEKETVYNAEESPYIIQELSPTVRGVLVVAEGAGNVSVKKQIQETIEALFGLDAHKISIMKMEVSR